MSNPTELQESYRVLEIPPGAPMEEVERAFESLTKSWDPKRFANDEPRRRKAEKKLRQLNRAYEKLCAELKPDDAEPPAETTATATALPPSSEAPRHWTQSWRYLWILALALAMGYLIYDSIVRYDNIVHTTGLEMSNYPLPQHDPTSPTGYAGNEHVEVLPALGTDGQHWAMQTERMVDGEEGWRVRHVDYDGVGPDGTTSGREVHWSSSLHWLAAGLAWVVHLFEHEPMAYALETTYPWANTFALGMVMLLLPIAVFRRLGSIGTALLALCFVAIYPYYEFSFVGYFDHHGLAATSELLMVLFIALAGAGWLRNDQVDPAALSPVDRALWQWLPERRNAKKWMIASGIAAGGGLWISAASIIPAMFGIGIAALLSTGFMVPTRSAKSVEKSASLVIALTTALGAIAGFGGNFAFGWASSVLALSGFGGMVAFTALGAGLGGLCGAVLMKGLLVGNGPEGAKMVGVSDPTVWRVWGVSAGCSSLFFYLLEYAPSHFTMRLEVNHPFYALALFGAGEVLCRMSEFIGGYQRSQRGFWARQWPWVVGELAVFAASGLVILVLRNQTIPTVPLIAMFALWFLIFGGYWAVRYFKVFSAGRPKDEDEAFWLKQWLLGLLGVVVIALLPATIMAFGDRVFVIRLGQFLLNLHMDYILEFRSVLHQFSTLSPMQIVGGISFIPLAALPMIMFLFTPELQRPWKAVLLVVLLPALVMLGLAMFQIRWLGISCAIWSAGLAVAALATTSPGSGYQWREGFRRPMALLLLMVVLLPFPINSIVGWSTNKNAIGDLDLQQIVTRDVSERLRTRLGSDPGVILSGPTTTTWMMYFGGFHGIGTLYWENVKGLEAAAQIYSAGPTWDDAKKLILAHHVTDIAIFSWDPFADQYAFLGANIRAPKTPEAERDQVYKLRNSFIIRLWDFHEVPPVWLRFIPYQVPETPLLKGQSVMLLEVVPDMTPAEAMLRYAEYKMTFGDPQSLELARQALAYSFQYQPDYYAALIGRADLEQMRIVPGGVDETQIKAAQGAGDATAFAAAQQQLKDDQNAYKTDVQAIIANLNKADDPKLAFEDRVNLALMLYDNNQSQAAFAQAQKCLDTATETDIRHLLTTRLVGLLELQAKMPADMKVSDKMVDFAMSILPPPNQGVVLAERANAVAATDPGKSAAIYRQALKLTPDMEGAMLALAKILVLAPQADVRNGQEALDLLNKQAQEAHEQSIENIQLMACASAEVGKFDDAVYYAKMALMLMEDAKDTADADEWRPKIDLFQNHQIYHLP